MAIGPLALVSMLMRTITPITALLLLVLVAPGCRDRGSDQVATATRQVDVPPISGELATSFRLIEQGDTGPARIRLRQWMELNGEDARALFLFGLAYHHERLYARSAEWFTRSIEAEPVFPPASHFLGWSEYYLGRPGESEAAFRNHILMTPGEGDSSYGLGLIKLDEGQLDEAEAFFQQAVTLQRNHTDRIDGVSKSLVRLAEIDELRGNDAQARERLQEAVSLFPDHYEAWYRLAKVRRRLGDEEGAIEAERTHQQVRQRVRPEAGFPE